MRDSGTIEKVRRGLAGRGFDRAYCARVARELAEHRLDLIEEALRQGVSKQVAESHADASLGSAEPLVSEFSARLSASAWLGRHQILGFSLLVLVGTLAWWSLLLLAAASAGGLLWAEKKTGLPPLGLDPFIDSIDWIRATSYLAVPSLICWAARRWHCGWRGALWGCLVAGIHNAMHNFVVSTADGYGTVAWGYAFTSANGPALLPVLAPLAIWAIDFAWNSRPEPQGDNSSKLHLL